MESAISLRTGIRKYLFSACKLLFAAILLVQLAGCTTKIPKKETKFKEGRIYRKGEIEPFSGIVMGYTYSKTGQKLAYEKEYEDGILNGDTKYFYPNGNLERVEPYKNGKINGIMTLYFENGQPKAKAHLVNGQRGGSSGEVFFLNDKPADKNLLGN